MNSKNLFNQPMKDLKIKEGAPNIRRSTKKEIESFSKEAKFLCQNTIETQKELQKNNNYNIQQLENKHFLLAGATGPGLGGAIACAVIELIKKNGSMTILSRDLSKSLGFETGKEIQNLANEYELKNRFQWNNSGMALEGSKLDKILQSLENVGAKKVIYINTVAAASSGIISNNPPVYVKDIDENGLFQWKLLPLEKKVIENTRFIMGEMAVQFPNILKQNGFDVEISVFADWRGSLDTISRDSSKPEYGRQGAYSTSLYLPKDIIQKETFEKYKTKNKYIDIFYPIMNTRALSFIPGGIAMSSIYEKLMHLNNIKRIDIPELALKTLKCIYENLFEKNDNPFPRLDLHEVNLELCFYEILKKLNNNENDIFFYKNWIL